ncbi:hypothetical protein GCM10010172_22100 [Paractinoplanes ferrugineus]|uniref:SnoaL-like domain-containing protein n=1 Tax=Paractinoplanes ferrugineus TaxID=113564 RepID=A0A919IVC8_9ACTN|nr:nuclear transport factor 2 family protein [Actinoplanes ferrugineus]GIE08879.1 hypothetical protein Afe05nite_07190 [Actinoplanes ferrugineus]
MGSLDVVSAWVSRFGKAWESNDAYAIGELFALDATYFSEPYAAPWRGRDQIVKQWAKFRHLPDLMALDWHPVLITEGLAVIEGTSTFPDRVVSNLWLLRLDKLGRARQFTQWSMPHPKVDQ